MVARRGIFAALLNKQVDIPTIIYILTTMKIKTYFDRNGLVRIKWMFRKKQAAFTLVELAMLIVILALATIGLHFVVKFW